jgi:hypothetical protein
VSSLWIDVNNKSEPAWSAKVDRWYQLDEVGYAFCEALHQWNYLEGVAKPDVIFLALPGASNLADVDFAQSGALSPAKFVYTLPNICIAVIFQMLGFSSKVYCVNRGASTVEFALSEANEMARAGKSAWVFSSSPVLENGKRSVSFASF